MGNEGDEQQQQWGEPSGNIGWLETQQQQGAETKPEAQQQGEEQQEQQQGDKRGRASKSMPESATTARVSTAAGD